MDQDTLRRLEEEESELSREVEGLELHYGALHQNTCLMEKRLETQQALLHALTGHRLVRPWECVTGATAVARHNVPASTASLLWSSSCCVKTSVASRAAWA